MLRVDSSWEPVWFMSLPSNRYTRYNTIVRILHYWFPSVFNRLGKFVPLCSSAHYEFFVLILYTVTCYLRSQPIQRFIVRQQLRKHATVLEPLLGSSLRATMGVQLEAVFSMWSAPRLYHAIDSSKQFKPVWRRVRIPPPWPFES
jgi:hypothetical protein